MFTGIVEEVGTVVEVVPTSGGRRLRIQAKTVMDDIELGASMSHNGTCLTITAIEDDGYWVEAVAETLERSTLGGLAAGSEVNLERPVRLMDRLGGHIVQGHVDGVAALAWSRAEGDSIRMRFELADGSTRYIVEKGSITVDGVSLTVTEVDAVGFEVAVIPHTQEVTSLGNLEPGSQVNIEVDVIAKYVEKLVTPS
jgi:riboflavin synthase